MVQSENFGSVRESSLGYSNLRLTIPRRHFFCRSFVLFKPCVCHAFASVHCCLVVTWREWADLLALVCDVYCCCFFYFLIMYHWTAVVLDCIDSWSLLSFLLYTIKRIFSASKHSICSEPGSNVSDKQTSKRYGNVKSETDFSLLLCWMQKIFDAF